MGVDLQKAGIWKRIAAWILDGILVCILTVGFAYALTGMMGYDGYNQTLQEGYAAYEAQYGVTFDMSQEAYLAMTEQERAAYDAAYEAMLQDADILHAYNMVVNLSLLVTTLGILLAVLVLEFVVPLLLKNGQTVGKKVFGIGVVRIDAVKITPLQLFVRALLGKYTVETMIPVYVIMMVFWGIMDITGTILLMALLLGQIICLSVTKNHAAIHDLLAGTVTVDLASQQVFGSTDELIAYTKRIHAERAQKQDY